MELEDWNSETNTRVSEYSGTKTAHQIMLREESMGCKSDREAPEKLDK